MSVCMWWMDCMVSTLYPIALPPCMKFLQRYQDPAWHFMILVGTNLARKGALCFKMILQVKAPHWDIRVLLQNLIRLLKNNFPISCVKKGVKFTFHEVVYVLCPSFVSLEGRPKIEQIDLICPLIPKRNILMAFDHWFIFISTDTIIYCEAVTTGDAGYAAYRLRFN